MTVSVPLNDLCACGSSSWIAAIDTAATPPIGDLRCAVCGLAAPEPPTDSGEPGAHTPEPIAHREEAAAVNEPGAVPVAPAPANVTATSAEPKKA